MNELFQQARSHHEQNRLDQAGEAYRRLLSTKPDHAEALLLYGVLLCQQSDAESGIEKIRQSICVQPDRAEAHYNLGMACQQVDRKEEAEAAYTEAIRLRPEYAQAHNNLGNSLHYRGDLEAARESFESALYYHPEFSEAWFNLGNVLRDQGQPKQAEEAYQKATALNPDSFEGFIYLSQAHRDMGRFQDALKSLKKAIELEPCKAEPYHALGTLYREQGFYDEALDAMLCAQDRDPTDLVIEYMVEVLKGNNPPRPPDEYVLNVFNPYATRFERHLVDTLDYRAPENLLEIYQQVSRQKVPLARVIDLGCGTGLAGNVFRPLAVYLEGVDLAPRMIERAREKKIYDRLEVQDVVKALEASPEPFDLIIATDVFIYIGDLLSVFKQAACRMVSAGCFVFSVEPLEDEGFKVHPSGRYAHSQDYISTLANEHGFKIIGQRRMDLRKERGGQAYGDYFVLEKL